MSADGEQEPTLYIMTDALICKAIAENPLMREVERAEWVVEFLSRAIVPEERDIYFDLVLARMKKLYQVRVE